MLCARNSPLRKLRTVFLCLYIVITVESGALWPTNASSPREIHVWIATVLTKVQLIKVGPQSSYLNLGFWGIVVLSLTFKIIFLAKPGKTNDRTERTENCIIAKHIRPTAFSKATKLAIVVAVHQWLLVCSARLVP